MRAALSAESVRAHPSGEEVPQEERVEAVERPGTLCYQVLAPLGEQAQRLLARFALPDLLAVIDSASSVRPSLAGGDHVQGVVELAVACQREPVAHHLPA